MIKKIKLFSLYILALAFMECANSAQGILPDERIAYHTVDLKRSDLRFFHRDPSGTPYQNLGQLKMALQKKGHNLTFGMNGGMYTNSLDPQGLYIEEGKQIAPLDTLSSGYGNFYLQPNGVFYVTTDNKAHVVPTLRFRQNASIRLATQSGPMLVIDGDMHPVFTKGSANVHIRNGVGILGDGKILFAISKERVNLYDFATFFMDMGCRNALYLDGFVSKMYLPEKGWHQTDGRLGVLIGEVN